MTLLGAIYLPDNDFMCASDRFTLQPDIHGSTRATDGNKWATVKAAPPLDVPCLLAPIVRSAPPRLGRCEQWSTGRGLRGQQSGLRG